MSLKKKKSQIINLTKVFISKLKCCTYYAFIVYSFFKLYKKEKEKKRFGGNVTNPICLMCLIYFFEFFKPKFDRGKMFGLRSTRRVVTVVRPSWFVE